MKNTHTPPLPRICATCGTPAAAPTLPGNGWIELVLWCAYIVPGLVYSIWRRTTRARTCAACGSRELVPVESPAGRAIVARFFPGGMPAAAPVTAAPAKRSPIVVVVAVLGLVGLCVVAVLNRV